MSRKYTVIMGAYGVYPDEARDHANIRAIAQSMIATELGSDGSGMSGMEIDDYVSVYDHEAGQYVDLENGPTE